MKVFAICSWFLSLLRVKVMLRLQTNVQLLRPAHIMQNVVDVFYPDAVKIIVIQDNLNTHTPASLYKAFKPAEAKRILEKLEFHYTPKHGSWLNMAEIE